MDPALPVTQPLDGPESDLSTVRKKGKQKAHVQRSQSEDYSTDPATENETVKQCQYLSLPYRFWSELSSCEQLWSMLIREFQISKKKKQITI